MRHRGDLSLRMYIAYFLNPPSLRPQDLDAIEAAHKKFHDEWIDAGAVKFMVDGVIESHTAAMLEPYSDDPSLKGKPFWEPANYNAAVAELDKRGISFVDVRHLLLTHIHLDHAGSTGSILERYPHIDVWVHERGVRHLIDPAKLIASASRRPAACR